MDVSFDVAFSYPQRRIFQRPVGAFRRIIAHPNIAHDRAADLTDAAGDFQVAFHYAIHQKGIRPATRPRELVAVDRLPHGGLRDGGSDHLFDNLFLHNLRGRRSGGTAGHGGYY